MSDVRNLYKVYGSDARFTHQPEADEWWQESSFLGWLDADSGIGGIFRLGLEPNWNGTGRVTLWSGVTTPDHAVYHRSDHFPFTPESRGERSWSGASGACSVSYEYDADDDRKGRWHLRDGGISVDLEITDLHTPKATFPSAGWTMKDRQAKDHLECGVGVRGRVEIAGRAYVIDGHGYRDHSWGIRHWDTLVAHRWQTGTLDNGTSFQITSWLNIDGTLFRQGMIVDHETDVATYSNDIDSIVFLEADGCSNRGGVTVMRMPDGAEHRFVFEPIGRAPVSWHEHVACLDAPSIVRCGDAKGVGIFETTNNPQQGKTKPLDTMVSGTVTNGLHTAPERVRLHRPFGNLLAGLAG